MTISDEKRLIQRLSADELRRHFLAPLAYHYGDERFRQDFIAAELIAELRAGQLAQAVSALANDDIDVILLKGVSYVGTIYETPGHRPMSDIDILVRAESHARAARALRRLGYWDAGSNVTRSPLHHAVCLKRKDGSIDLHRSMIQPLRSRIDVAAMWERSRPALETDQVFFTEISGADNRARGLGDRPKNGADDGRSRVFRLDPVDELVIHLVHVARHEFLVPIINYIDAIRLMERVETRRDEVWKRAREFRVERATLLAFSMAEAVVKGHTFAPNQGISQRLFPNIDEILAARPAFRPLQILRKFYLVEGPGEFAGLVAAASFDRVAARWSRPKPFRYDAGESKR